MPTEFGRNPAIRFQEKNENVKTLTRSGRRITHDAQSATED